MVSSILYCITYSTVMDLNKHFIVTLRRNVGGGAAGVRGGGGA
jgi:hypothetical protein